MNIINRIDRILNEKAQVRNFKNVKEIADFVLKMENKVKDRDAKKFDDQLNRRLKIIDPSGDLSTYDAIMKMSLKEAKRLYSSLNGFHFDDLDA